MSERYGKCKQCGGKGTYIMVKKVDNSSRTVECQMCLGTGESGDAMDYVQREADRQFQQDGLGGITWSERGWWVR